MEWLVVAAIGFVVGSLAKLLKRELDPGGFLMPMLIGIGGAGLVIRVHRHILGSGSVEIPRSSR